MNSSEMKPLVSISCITYNHKDYIIDTLNGFLMQKTNFPFEVLIHDDCSTDGTTEIIREYAKKYPEIIKPMYERENQYQHGKPFGSEVWNYPRAKGKYIALCEGDDYWIDPYKLQKQVDFLEANPDYGMCYTNFDIKNEVSGRYISKVFDTLPKIYQKEYSSVEEFIIRRGYVCPPSWLFRRELMPKATFGSLDTTFVYFAYFLTNTKVKYLPDSTTVYRILGESASHTSNPIKAYDRAENLLKTQKKLIEVFNLDPSLNILCEISFYSDNLVFFIENQFEDDVQIAKSIVPKSELRNQILFLVYDLKLWRLLKFIHKLKHKIFKT